MLYEKTHTTKRNKLGKFADDRCKANCEGVSMGFSVSRKKFTLSVKIDKFEPLVVKRKKRP